MTIFGADLQSLTHRANDLKAAGRLGDAIAVYAQAAAQFPASAVAEHNLAAALGDAARHAEAETHVRRAFAKGLDAPETWVVYARALQGQARLSEAETAFHEAIRRRPSMADAHRDLAQLIWMRSEDVAAATAPLSRAIAADPHNPVLRLVLAKALQYAGDDVGAYAALRAVQREGDFVLEAMSADAATRIGDAPLALGHAERAMALAPDDGLVRSLFAQACLASGQPERAVDVLTRLRAEDPTDQHAIALLATTWRMLGDARYRELYDYDAFVGVRRLVTPEGWADLDAYLADLAEAISGAHAYRGHPFDQSLRHGSQAPDILTFDHPAVRAFSAAVTPAIEAHLAHLGQAGDPVRARNTGRWAFQGVWSVRLRPHGFHADHVHTRGWLSSACYIALPSAIENPGREGWLKFGEPGVATHPHLPPEHFVKPEPGLLALFPSYMWHGTVPFSGDQPRLTIAFDLVPA